MKSGKDVNFFEGGGELKDRATGRTIKIHEIDGTYFMRLKVDDPLIDTEIPPIPADLVAPLGRQGR